MPDITHIHARGKALIALLLITFLLTSPASAQDDGGQRLQEARVGAYKISVWTGPEPPVHGPMRVTVQLMDATSGEMTTTPEITVLARAPHRDVLQAQMTPDDGGRYTAEITIPYAELWTINLVVKDNAVKTQISFPLDIQAKPINENLIRLGAFAMLVVLVSGWWFWGRHPRKKKTRKRIFMPRPEDLKRK